MASTVPAAPAATAASRIRVRPVSPAIGAEVHCGDVNRLDADTFAEVHRAFLDHLVLLIRGQSLDVPGLLAFGRRFGTLSAGAPVHIGQKPRDETFPELVIISNVVENGVAIGSLGDGEAVWHTDSAFSDVPPSLSILYSVAIPPTGGDTGFASMYAALDSLPKALRTRIAGLTIKHDKRYTSGGQLREGYLAEQDLRESPGPSHPIIRRHPETGRSALYLGRRPNAYVNGLSLEDSEALLDELWSYAVAPELTWHHQWKLGDILVWDNRCAMHRRDSIDPATRRIMHRTQCKGTPLVAGA